MFTVDVQVLFRGWRAYRAAIFRMPKPYDSIEGECYQAPFDPPYTVFEGNRHKIEAGAEMQFLYHMQAAVVLAKRICKDWIDTAADKEIAPDHWTDLGYKTYRFTMGENGASLEVLE